MRVLTILLSALVSQSGAEPSFDLSWKTDLTLGFAGVGMFALGQYQVMQLEPYEPGSFQKQDLLPWDRPFAGTWNPKADLASNILTAGAVLPFALSVPLWTKGQIQGSELVTQIVMFSEVMALQSGVNLLVRSREFWPRPFLFSSRGGTERTSKGGSGSFYSGHTSAAFAVATFSSYWYDQVNPGSIRSPWLWVGTLTAAGSMAILRVAAGKHYPTDVVVGALVGSAIGWAVPWMHQRNSAIKIAPQPGGAIGYLSF